MSMFYVIEKSTGKRVKFTKKGHYHTVEDWYWNCTHYNSIDQAKQRIKNGKGRKGYWSDTLKVIDNSKYHKLRQAVVKRTDDLNEMLWKLRLLDDWDMRELRFKLRGYYKDRL